MSRPDGRGNAAKRVALAEPGPWKTDPSWLRMKSRYQRAVRFIETYCRPSKGARHGQPLKLAGFQKTFLRQALADGVDVAVLATPRGNGKSSLGGALATWALFDDDFTGSPQVPVIATTITQAIRSCYGVAVSMIKNEPELAKRALIYTGMGTTKVAVPFNEGELFPVSNDPDGLQGLDPSLAIVDEIGFQPAESWDSLRMASGKRERSLVIGVGTPGYDRDTALFAVRKAVHEAGRVPSIVFHEYAAPDGCAIDDRTAWRKANPAIRARFLREDAIATDLHLAHEGPFRIFRLGQWVEGVESWLGANGGAIWDGLRAPYEFAAGAQTWLGVDMALTRDTTAVVAVQRDADDGLHAAAKVWTPTAEQQVDVTDVMQHIRELARSYDVRAVSYDPRFFDLPAKQLGDEGLPLVKIDQSVERMTTVIGSLYELIKGGGIHHTGDEQLRRHVLNAVPRFNERGFTLQKTKSRGHIDAVIALALAVDRAQRQEPAPEVLVAWA